MIDRKRILVIIPAKGGSKGIPRKNTRLLAGIFGLMTSTMLAFFLESLEKHKQRAVRGPK